MSESNLVAQYKQTLSRKRQLSWSKDTHVQVTPIGRIQVKHNTTSKQLKLAMMESFNS